MINDEFREIALSFPQTEEATHFDRRAFKVIKKRIFATLHEESGTANLKLSLEDQASFSAFGKGAVYAVPNKWGQQGWTSFEIAKLPEELILDALDSAYQAVFKAKKK